MRYRLKFGLTPVVLLSLTACNGEPAIGEPDPPAGRQIVWQDEFDGPAGQLPDAANWRFDIGTNWGNNQLEWDTNRPENVSLDGNGNLAITARQESFMGQQYTSGRITTMDLFEQRYGRFEARIRLPVGQGIWPAFWMLGDDFTTVGWPQTGEIDIMEYLGHQPTVVHGSLHGPGYSGGSPVTGNLQRATGFDDDFHLFAVEWTANSITWLVDDQPYQAVTTGDVPGTWVFDHPFFILLNVAVGGNWPGAPDASTVFPQTMLVDYVRVYAPE